MYVKKKERKRLQPPLPHSPKKIGGKRKRARMEKKRNRKDKKTGIKFTLGTIRQLMCYE